MLGTQFSPWPSFSEEEADAVKRVLLSNKVNYWTGQECREFEKEFAGWCGAKHAIALTNGTVALDLALQALGVGVGDEVIVTPRTFLASVSSVVTCGATPVFADVDRDNQNITSATISKVLTPKTKAVIVVHLAGMPSDMDEIMALAKLHNFYVIEDCAQAHGARYKDKSVGVIGHVGAWSFCQDKIMTTGGEGGMVTTNDSALWSKMWSYKDHGKNYESVYEDNPAPGFRWLHDSFGTNWRMTELQGVIGRIQLARMENWSAKRREYANLIWSAASECKGLRVPIIPDYIQHAAYKCYVFVEPAELQADWDRDRIISEIKLQGVPCYSGSCSEVYLEKAFAGTGFRPAARLEVAKELGDTALMFLVHPTLSENEIQKTVDALKDVMQKATK